MKLCKQSTLKVLVFIRFMYLSFIACRNPDRQKKAIRMLIDHGCQFEGDEKPEEVVRILQYHNEIRISIRQILSDHSFNFPTSIIQNICDFLLPSEKESLS